MKIFRSIEEREAFDAIADGVNAAVKPIKDSVKNKKVNYRE